MKTTYKQMIREQRANDGVQELERVPVLFDASELNYIKLMAGVMNLPFTTVVRVIVREHKAILAVTE